MLIFKCKILLDREVPIYFSGEQIKGQLILETDTSLKDLNFLFHVKLIGFSTILSTSDKKYSLSLARKVATHISDQFYQDFFWFQDALMPQFYEDIKTRQFKFQLLERLPTSCKTSNSEIKYEIQLHMERFVIYKPTIRLQHTQPITIVQFINSIGRDLFSKSWYLDIEQLFSCRLERGCFYPGECVNFVLNLPNHPILYAVEQINVALQEIHELKEYPVQMRQKARYTLHSCKFSNIIQNIRSKNGTKKSERCLSGSLTIPITTVPFNSKCRYCAYLTISYLINIRIRCRFPLCRFFAKSGYSKHIKIALKPYITGHGELSEHFQRDNTTIHKYIKCLPVDETYAPNAFIPKFAITDSLFNI